MDSEKRTLALRVAALTLILGASAISSAYAAGTYVVRNTNDFGPGSLRYGLQVAEASRIVIPRSISNINIDSTIKYSSDKHLKIIASGQTVSTLNNVTLLAITRGANVSIRNLHLRGPGGWSILNRGDRKSSAGKGLFIDVRDNQTGTLKVHLKNFSVSGVAYHGVHVSDCSLADECGGGSGGGGDGSPASIHLTCTFCKFYDVGNGTFDADGIRVDDRGDGGITAIIRNSSFMHVGADGNEYDEGDNGNVNIKTVNTVFRKNGGYCDPEIIGKYIPEDDEFDESERVTEDDLPVPGSPDDSCIEVETEEYDSGFLSAVEYGNDVDDGIDGDEAGSGSLYLSMINTAINSNLDEGVDMDEGDAGNLVVRVVRSSAMFNTGDGFKMTEEDGGNMIGKVLASNSAHNGGKGFVFEEEKAGNLRVNVVASTTSMNDDSDDTGIEAVQEAPGTGTLRVRGSHIADGIDTDGVDEI